MKIELIDFEIKGDDRGSLIALESIKNIPFSIKRVYFIYNTKENVTRGRHAHKKLNQVAVCVNGNCTILLDDGKEKKSILLDFPNIGLIIREMIWRDMYDFSDDCVLLVLASELYDEADYIRTYDDFREMVKDRK